ncbi:hypothetical protein [Nonomuraea sp. NPDC049646]|uniref:hypothetical protein n=1 Tax=unclassified Nonomuraea TaxID=2593643 RepID=UPI0037B8150F
MHVLTWIAAAVLTTAACATSTPVPPPASANDPAGIVMGVKQPAVGSPVLMVGLLNQGRAYERAVTAAQAAACTRRAAMSYPICLPKPRRVP